ncbi:acetylglucosaminyldiphospho-UDP acetyl-beta-D-mannosaminyltransferase [Bacillus sp. MKU004]|nr:acetylglucosaminyldiphospho-UDP acetyl-beta-D-mannosaminyltransferase [Bacillus sp. MKU004]
MFRKLSIFDIPFVHATKKEVTGFLENNINIKRKTFVVTANPEIVMYAKKDPVYKKTVQKADIVVADGIGVIIGSKMMKQPLPERIPGFELMTELLEMADTSKWRVYLLGAKPEVVTTAADNIKKKYPGLTIAGTHHGYFKDHDETVTNAVKDAQPDLIFVALGFPRQEMWIEQAMPQFNKGLFMGVGGSFDVFAGTVQRAPEIWQKLNLEWFYRLLKQPSRWKRMLVLPQFIIEVWKTKGR